MTVQETAIALRQLPFGRYNHGMSRGNGVIGAIRWCAVSEFPIAFLSTS